MSIEKLSSQPALHTLDNTKTPGEHTNSYEIKHDHSEEEKIHKNYSKKELEHIIDGINEMLQPSNTHLKFELHEELNEYYVTIINDYTNEVVREIPSKKWLDIYASMTEFVGLLVDRKI
ncbi:flagellar protein FlaG [Metabacillus endolithicus]|uniref:Flagellar protein FlaG n=1 Tax=Metabacillus endolithicus TaxID=1535204 RepID=A0ABW5BZ24_9BACI|nr:flagellar protein FlaG [Metabacillus endolithicus]UPG65362.1 flagellar protein FlaG [Metabacillus endolithicus]